jgi:hypothetical protein
VARRDATRKPRAAGALGRGVRFGMCFDSADEPDWDQAESPLGQSPLGKRSEK